MILRPLDPIPASSTDFLPAWNVVEQSQRQVADSCWMVTQPSHAALAGEFDGLVMCLGTIPRCSSPIRFKTPALRGRNAPIRKSFMSTLQREHGLCLSDWTESYHDPAPPRDRFASRGQSDVQPGAGHAWNVVCG